jgi:hypothetical protein
MVFRGKMPRDVIRLFGFCALLTGALPFASFALPSASEVYRKLILAFTDDTGRQKHAARIVEKEYVGVRTQTIVFELGPRTYRVVFTNQETVTVSLTKAGALAAQPLFEGDLNRVTVEEIVNAIYTRETGRAYGAGPAPKTARDTGPDRDAARVALRWNSLMNRILAGDTAALASRGGGSVDRAYQEAAAVARSMDPCGQNRGAAAARKGVVQDVVSAMAAAAGASPSAEARADRSRDYNRKKTESVLRDLEGYRDPVQPEEAFRLIQQSRSDAYEIFRRAVETPDDPEGGDAYALAAARNLRPVARSRGAAGGRALVDRVLDRTVVDVETFTALRRSSPKAPVIFERTQDKFFVDPTLNSPSQARYLLSLAVLYAWNLEEKPTADLLRRYAEAYDRMSKLQDTVLYEEDLRELRERRAEVDRLSGDLFSVAERLRRSAARPPS